MDKATVRALIWWLYPDRKAELKTRFNTIFKRRPGFATLDRLLDRLHANRAELPRMPALIEARYAA